MHLAYPANPAIDQSGIRTRDRHVASTALSKCSNLVPRAEVVNPVVFSFKSKLFYLGFLSQCNVDRWFRK